MPPSLYIESKQKQGRNISVVEFVDNIELRFEIYKRFPRVCFLFHCI